MHEVDIVPCVECIQDLLHSFVTRREQFNELLECMRANALPITLAARNDDANVIHTTPSVDFIELQCVYRTRY